MRRITILSFLAAGLLAPVQEVSAGPIAVGTQLRLYDGPGSNGGGEFHADAAPFGSYDFITFCLQLNEFFAPGQTMYVGGVTNHTVLGNDPISPQTAFLYTAFSNQTLNNYAFTGNVVYNGVTYDRVKTGTALQMAFWSLENEVTRDSNGVFRNAYTNASFGANPLADYYIGAANASGWNGIGQVRVLNLYGNFSPSAGFSGHRQDQLYLVPVPEPGTLSLLGLGLLAASRVLRRRSPRKGQTSRPTSTWSSAPRSSRGSWT